MTVSLVAARRRVVVASRATLLLLALGLAAPAKADMATAQSAITAGNFPAAGAALAPLAESGDPQAQYQWAALALDGHPVGLQANQALSLLIQSAAQGNSHAAARLGMAYANGDQVPANKLAAYHWLSRANAAPDLTDAERASVTALQQSLLDELAPKQQASADPSDAPPPPKTDTADKQPQKPADKAKSSPTTVADIQMPAHTPLLQPDDATLDNATLDHATGDPATGASAGSTKNSGKQTVTISKAAPTAGSDEPAPAIAAPVAPVTMAAAPVSAGVAAPAAGKSVYMVQMASLPSAKAASSEASRLQKKYAKLLGGAEVSVRAADLGSKGVMQRVVAGPYDTLAAAKDQCAQLSAQKQACRVFKTSSD